VLQLVELRIDAAKTSIACERPRLACVNGTLGTALSLAALIEASMKTIDAELVELK